jgi:Cof subfamily protein (haloacid dehalogenase superfamily)
MRARLIALDIDGTLLDPYGKLSSSASGAVAAASRRGLRVVLCTGRRFRTALPVATELSLSGSMVVHNGALVKDIESGDTRFDNYLPSEIFRDLLELLRAHGPPMVYVDSYHERTDILTERRDLTHEFQNEYLDDNPEFTRIVDDLAATDRDDVIMINTMAEAEVLEPLRERIHSLLGDRVLSHLLMNKGYRGHILEFISPSSGKWGALRAIAARAGIAPEEIAAVGDDTNDAEMIREAGLGIAMGNSAEAALAAANVIVKSNAEGGVIEAIERVLLES